MQHRYSEEFSSPPALILSAEIRFASLNHHPLKCRAKLDTAADLTVLPKSFIERLNPLAFNTFVIRQTGGTEKSYLLEVLMEGRRYSVEAVTHHRPYLLVGRDILNQLKLIADGPRELFELIHPNT